MKKIIIGLLAAIALATVAQGSSVTAPNVLYTPVVTWPGTAPKSVNDALESSQTQVNTALLHLSGGTMSGSINMASSPLVNASQLSVISGGTIDLIGGTGSINANGGTLNMGGGAINHPVLASTPSLGDNLDAVSHQINNVGSLGMGGDIQMNGHTLVNLGTLNQEVFVAAPTGTGTMADFHGTDATKQNNILVHGAGTETYIQLHNDADPSSWDFVDSAGTFSLIDDLTDHTLFSVDSDLTQLHAHAWFGANTGRTGLDVQVQENANGQGNLANFSSSAGGSLAIHDNGDLTLSGSITSSSAAQSSFSGQINMNSNPIVGLAAPQNPADAATKGYVDEFDGAIPVSLVSNGNDLTGSEGDGTTAAVQPGGSQKSPPITVAAVVDNTTYSFNIGASLYSINSGVGATATSILNALAAAVTADVSAIVTASVNGTPALVLTEKSVDTNFTLTSVTANLSPTGTVAGVNPFIGKGGQVATKNAGVWSFNSSYAAGTLVTPNFPRIGQFFELNNDHASWTATRTVSRMTVDKSIDPNGNDGRLELEGGPILWNGSSTAPSPGFGGPEAGLYFDSVLNKLMIKESASGDGGASWFSINSSGRTTFPRDVIGNEPTCDAAHVGQSFMVNGNGGGPDHLDLCEEAFGVYAWSTPGALPAPITAQTPLVFNYMGGDQPASFIGVLSDSDQTQKMVALGSSDTAVLNNATSNTALVSGDVTSANPANTGASGDVRIHTGSVLAGSGPVGTLQIIGGNGGTGGAGNINIFAGVSTGGVSGRVNLAGGDSNSVGGTPGSVSIQAGSDTVGASSGTVTVTSGNSTTGPGGAISIVTGTGTSRGKLQIQDGSEGTVGHVWTSTDTVGNGHWAAAAASGANTSLSNLVAPTAMNADLLPNADNAVNLGSVFPGGLNFATLNVDKIESESTGPLSFSFTQTSTTVKVDPSDYLFNIGFSAFSVNTPITLSSSGTLPNGLAAATTYYVSAPVGGVATHRSLSLTPNGSVVAISSVGSGTLTVNYTGPTSQVVSFVSDIDSGGLHSLGTWSQLNTPLITDTGGALALNTGNNSAVEVNTTFGGGTPVAFQVNPTVTGTTGYTALLINPLGTEGTGPNLLIDAQVAGADKFVVDAVGNMTLTGHIVNTEAAPTTTVNANAGTSATCAVSANSTDMAGVITLVSGTAAWAAGDQCDVNFHTAFGAAPICVFSPGNANAAGTPTAEQPYLTTSTSALSLNLAGSFSVVTGTYVWSYYCLQ